MDQKLLLPILLFFGFIGYSQNEESFELQGKIFADSADTQDVVVINKRTKKGTVSMQNGMFNIEVKVTDTLQIRSLQFQDKEMVVTEKHFKDKNAIIFLKPKVTILKEIELSPLTLTGDLIKDSKKIPIKTPSFVSTIDFSKKIEYADDKFYKGPPITTTPNTFAATPLNFVGVFDLIFGKPKPDPSLKRSAYDKIRNNEKLDRYNSQSFSEQLLTRVPKSFFTADLKIEESQLISYFAFVQFSDKDLLFYFNEDNKLQLIEYLTKKSEEFLSNSKTDNVNLLHED